MSDGPVAFRLSTSAASASGRMPVTVGRARRSDKLRIPRPASPAAQARPVGAARLAAATVGAKGATSGTEKRPGATTGRPVSEKNTAMAALPERRTRRATVYVSDATRLGGAALPRGPQLRELRRGSRRLPPRQGGAHPSAAGARKATATLEGRDRKS